MHGGMEVDSMAALDAATGGAKPAFVAAKETNSLKGSEKEKEPVEVGNADEIAMDDDDDE